MALAAAPRLSGAAGISVEFASAKQVSDAYYLDAKIRFEFDDEVLNALEHGVELHIDVLARVRRERKWLWDPLLAEQSLSYTLEHHPLSEDYVVTDLNSDTRHQFPSYKAALRFIGTINNLRLVDSAEIKSDSEYYGSIRARLNIDTLPAPLQPTAYVSEKWHVETPWYEWAIR